MLPQNKEPSASSLVGDHTITERIQKCLSASIADNRLFSPKHFFQHWFRDHGKAYLSLFRKNLKVTNLQIAELHALLRVHIIRTDTKAHVRDLQFISADEFNASVQSIVESFSVTTDAEDPALDLISRIYKDLLRDVVVFDIYFGSCTVFLPHNLDVDDLAGLCAHSGYVHSCGPSLLNRNITKATKQGIFSRLSNYIEDHLISEKLPARFIVYAHEEFTPNDRYIAGDLKDGLDDVKLYLDKYYVGNESLVGVLKEMRQTFAGKLLIPEPGHYKRLLKETAENIAKQSSQPTIWLIVDHKPSADIRHRGDRQYFVFYHQQFINENQFHFFDENKPAWIDHTTIPHTLVSAMINVTRPWWHSDGRNICIGDPFVGTGTTLLEALKFGASHYFGDLALVADLLFQDNLRFFNLARQEVQQLISDISEAVKIDPKVRQLPAHTVERYGMRQSSPVESDYFTALDIFERVCPDPHSSEAVITASVREDLANATLRQRLLFYIALRTHRRTLAARERDEKDWQEAFQGEAGLLISQMQNLIELRERQELGKPLGNSLISFPGKYSEACCIAARFYRDIDFGTAGPVRTADVRNFPEGTCDVIVTDPPYGLNSEMSRRDLAVLYQDMFIALIRGLRDDGHLVFALPDWSHIGRQIPFFMTKQFVTQHILALAEKENREIVQTAYTVPSPGDAFRPPYYWESDRALRRAILHFRIRKVYPEGGRSDIIKVEP